MNNLIKSFTSSVGFTFSFLLSSIKMFIGLFLLLSSTVNNVLRVLHRILGYLLNIGSSFNTLKDLKAVFMSLITYDWFSISQYMSVLV